MANPTVKTIADLPAGPTDLVGTELVEIQDGVGLGASKQSTAAKVADIALRQSVQSVQAGAGDVGVDSTDPNNPIVSVPVPVAGHNLSIDRTDPQAPIYNSTTPVAGGITASYGVVGGPELQAGNSVVGIATAAYTITGWRIQCVPSGSIAIDIKIGTLGGSTSSMIGAGDNPDIVGSTYASSTDVSTWDTVDIARGSVVEVSIKSVSTVQWYSIAFLGDRV